MSERVPTLSARRVSTLRQLKVLVVLLIFSNIALGGFGFYSLRTIDRKYSRLISQTVPALNDLEELTTISVEAMRNTNPMLYGASTQSRPELSSRARSALGRQRELRERIAQNELSLIGREQGQSFQKAGEAFDREATAIIDLLTSARDIEAQAMREHSLRPIFERYLAEVTKTADLVEAQSLRASETLSARTSSISNIMLGVAGWPVFILMAVLIAILVVILFIRVFLFRQESPI